MTHVFHRDPRLSYPVAVRGEGAYIFDRDGKRYLDASGGAAVSCLGHSDRAVTEAIRRQLEKLPFAHTSFFTNEPMEALADAKGLSLRHVPTRAWIDSDPQLLRRVLQNFLSNAVKYTRRGRILFGCRRHGERLRIEVWDSGPGIADTDRGAIFEEFRRLDRGAAGLGLGLAIAERIAQLLEAPLTLRSWPGHGSVFSIELPLAPASAHEGGEAADAGGSARARVLVVDNDAAVLAATRTLLAGWQCEVLAATDLDGARALCANARPDLLLLDYHLDGGFTGLDLRAHLGGDSAALPCIVITADHGEDVRRAVIAAGCHLLHKPLKPLALKSLMGRLLGEG